MLISHARKFVFIHIYKTAGTSVREVFLPYARLIDRAAYEFVPTRLAFSATVRLMGWHDDGMKQFTGFHKHASAYEVREKLGKRFDSYFTFAFVRNPFDLLVSLYEYIRRSPRHRNHSFARKATFTEFLEFHVEEDGRQQVSFLTDPRDGRCLVDYVGRFETLGEDVARIRGRLGLPPVDLPRRNSTSPREVRDYRTRYGDPARRLVERHFRDDLTRLGYAFDGARVRPPPGRISPADPAGSS